MALVIVALNTKADSPGFAAAKDLFETVAPIATAVVTYWFASRAVEKVTKKEGANGNNNNS